MHRIMLKFRPIAPKPHGGAHPSAAAEQDRKNGKRTKRKYVSVRRRQTTKTKGRSPQPDKKLSGVDDMAKAAVTLQLLPESENSCCSSGEIVDRDPLGVGKEAACGGGTTAATWIVVECVTDAYVDGGVGIGFSDREIIENLQGDTCPGFVSDSGNNVVWVNDAYRRMAAERGGAVVVRLVAREKLPYFSPSFACRVRMIQQTKQGQKRNRIVALRCVEDGNCGVCMEIGRPNSSRFGNLEFRIYI